MSLYELINDMKSNIRKIRITYAGTYRQCGANVTPMRRQRDANVTPT